MNYELKQALRPVKMKIRRNRFLRGTVTGLAAGLGTAVLLQAVSFFVPVPDRGLWAAAAGAAVLLLTAIGNALRPVKNNTAAEAADACGLKERVITARERMPAQRLKGWMSNKYVREMSKSNCWRRWDAQYCWAGCC